MSPRLRSRSAQRGLALLLLLVVVVVAFTYVLMSRLPLATHQTATKREYNAKVLNQAKQALIGYMVLRAAQSGEDDPGSLPCPEAAGNAGNPALEGIAAGNCAVPAMGRLPWRTLGLDKLVDDAAEPLWYAVSPGWHKPNSTTNTVINSDSVAQLTVDGAANSSVAVIIAPGRAMNVQAAPGCTARNQTRAAPAPTMNPADYVECFNAATATFSTVGPAASFNDQVLALTTGDLIPELEAAIQQRMQREIAPALRTVYASAVWGQTAANPVYPFAARFNNPDPGSGNSYRGEDGRYQGLLPFNCSDASCASDSRYSPTFVNWGSPSLSGTAVLGGSTCSIQPGNVAQCTGLFAGVGTLTFSMTIRLNNIAMALRQFDLTNVATLTYGVLSCSSTGTITGTSFAFQNDGSAILTVQGQAPGLVGPPPGLLPLTTNICMTAQLGNLKDHSLLNQDDPTTGWFVRNEWYRLVWYAVAARNTVDNLTGTPPVPVGCVNNPPTTQNCLGINGTRNIRSLLVLAGRSLTNPAGRPNSTLSDYLEFANCDPNFLGVCNPGSTFEQRTIRMNKVAVSPAAGGTFYAPFNDRLVLVDWIAPAPTFPVSALLP